METIEFMHPVNIATAQRNDVFWHDQMNAPRAGATIESLSVIPCLDGEVGLRPLYEEIGTDTQQKVAPSLTPNVPVVDRLPLRFFSACPSMDVVSFAAEMGFNPFKQGPVTVEDVNGEVKSSLPLHLQLDRTFTIQDSCDVGESIHTPSIPWSLY